MEVGKIPLCAASLGVSAYFGKAHMPSGARDTARMRHDPNETVAANLRALMLHAGMQNKGEPNQSDLARASGANQRTVGRILAREQSPTVEMLETIARAFGLHAWQLLIPGLDPANPPVVVMSEAERQFYRRLEELRTAEPPPRRYITN